MNKNELWPWMIKNSIAIIAWAFLAIVFEKWWIALFGLLFLNDFTTKYKSYRVCDKCGKHSPYADSYNEALEKAQEAGWVHCEDGNKDYCPECIRSDTHVNV